MKAIIALAVDAIGIGTAANAAVGDQIIVKDLVAARGWTAIVPLNFKGDSLTDMLSYNANTGSPASDPCTTLAAALICLGFVE